MLVVVASRSIPPLLTDLVSTEIRLSGLDPRSVGELAARRGRALNPSLVRVLRRHTDGNPRDIVALLAEVPPEMWSRPDVVLLPAPTHVIEHLREQLASCDPRARELVEALAILGEEATLAEATALAGLEEPLAAVDSALAAGLLTSGGPAELRMREPLSRPAIVGLIPPKTVQYHLTRIYAKLGVRSRSELAALRG